MKLIVGLGNPGSEYNNTRHNIGFMVIDKITQVFDITMDKNKFDGIYGTKDFNDEKIIFLKPQKYMNLSGEVIRKYVDYFKINTEDILIISDDLDLPLGKMKIKFKGSSGGHNGLKNIEQHLNTSEYKRIKIGISNDKMIDTKNYVLGHFSKEDLDIIKPTIDKMPEVFEQRTSIPHLKGLRVIRWGTGGCLSQV